MESYSFIEVTRTLEKIVKVSFFRTLALTRDLQQFEELLLTKQNKQQQKKKKQLNLGKNFKLCSVLTCPIAISCPQLHNNLTHQQPHNYVNYEKQWSNRPWNLQNALSSSAWLSENCHYLANLAAPWKSLIYRSCH